MAQSVSIWPPALNEPHRCGAKALAVIYLTVPELSAVHDAYAWLLGAKQNQIKLNEGDEIRVFGLVFRIQFDDETRSELGEILSYSDEDGVSWVRSTEITGVRIGFTFAKM